MAKPFVLECADFVVESACIRHGRSGATFQCTLKHVAEETREALEDAVRSRRSIRFAFPKHPLVLEGTEVVQRGPGRIEIVGRVLEAG